MNKRGLGRAAIAVVAGVLATTGLAGPAFAEEEEPSPLLLAQQFQQKVASELAGEYADCTGIPGGAVAGTAAWRFDQPVPEVAKPQFMFLFNAGTDEAPEPVVLALLDDELVRLDLGEGGGDALKSQLVAPKKAADEEEEPAELPLPAGVSGGRLDDGDAWLRLPPHWEIFIAALDVTPTKTELTTFDVAGVCLPTEATPTPGAPATTAPATPPAGLPVTGTSTNAWWIAGVGALAVLAGAMAILILRRRRDPVKFVA
jgi:LPXTG-motif cell wall-anchored protein